MHEKTTKYTQKLIIKNKSKEYVSFSAKYAFYINAGDIYIITKWYFYTTYIFGSDLIIY